MVESFQDKRRLSRIRIALPIRVRGTNCKGIQFEEMTRSIDVNGDGALFLLNQDLKKGMRLKLSLPLPRSMQKSAVSKAVYETEAVVVRIEVSDDPVAHVEWRFDFAVLPPKRITRKLPEACKDIVEEDIFYADEKDWTWRDVEKRSKW